MWNYGEARQNPAIVIEDSDFIVGGVFSANDVHAVLQSKGITDVIHSGIAENMCVEEKGEGIPMLTRLGYHCVLARDLTDAESHYDPMTWRPAPQPWVSLEWGTRNVTAAIERVGIAWTIEGASLAVDAGLWSDDKAVDSVMHAPWGTLLRPHLFDYGCVVALSTACDMEATVGCGQAFDIRFTLNGSVPTPNSSVYRRPFNVSAVGTTVVRAAGFARDGSGRTTHVESSSVLVRRLVPGPDDGSLPRDVLLNISDAPILWGHGDDDFYRYYPMKNLSWLELPLAMRGHHYTSGLGLKAPIHLNYNLSQIRDVVAPAPLRVFRGAVGIDDSGCDGRDGDAGHDKPDSKLPHVGSGNCHDIAEWQRAVLKVYRDGELIQTSPVLQAETLAWTFELALPAASQILRFVVMAVGDDGVLGKGQDAYDFVDLLGGFA